MDQVRLKIDQKGLKIVYLYWLSQFDSISLIYGISCNYQKVEQTPSEEIILNEVRFRGSPTIDFALSWSRKPLISLKGPDKDPRVKYWFKGGYVSDIWQKSAGENHNHFRFWQLGGLFHSLQLFLSKPSLIHWWI